MEIKKEFAPVTIVLKTPEDLQSMKEIARQALLRNQGWSLAGSSSIDRWKNIANKILEL